MMLSGLPSEVSMVTTREPTPGEATTPAPELLAFDHLEWWVGNARHAAHFFVAGFGFDVVAYAGPETGARDRQSYVLRQGDLCFVVTSALDPDSEVAAHVRRHGDGVRDVAYLVHDVDEAYRRAVARGGTGAEAPRSSSDDDGELRRAAVGAFGDTIHTLISRDAYRGLFAPGYEPASLPVDLGRPVGLTGYDHVVVNVERGRLDEWVAWYERVWGLRQMQHFSEDAISTEYSALRSTVVWNGGRVVQPINEPAPGRRKSQIEEYLDYYHSPGVQHVAIRTDDIIATVSALHERGIRFLRVPDTYYDEAPERLGELGADLPWEQLASLGILVDRDTQGYLLQIFTENVASRPTVFLEIIQRAGARGFGEGNFKALFVSIEAEQARRGNL
jgi:4-hydroxyphenylpyruvate dioxygenase